MSVPAFRNSRSRVRRRRSHHALKPMRIAVDSETGEMVLPHHAKPIQKETSASKKAAAKKSALEAVPKAADAIDQETKAAIKQSTTAKKAAPVRKAGRKK